MKRLPGKFIVVNRHYCFKNKYSVSIFKIVKILSSKRYWQLVKTLRIFVHLNNGKKYGKWIAKQLRIGYIENIARNQMYQRKHRTSMILYDRDESLNLKPGGKIK